MWRSSPVAQRVPIIVAELGQDVEQFLQHLYAALAEKERAMMGSSWNLSQILR